MVDVGAKPETERVAVARAEVKMRPGTLALIQSGGVPKGDVIGVARVAGIMAAKRTAELIPSATRCPSRRPASTSPSTRPAAGC